MACRSANDGAPIVPFRLGVLTQAVSATAAAVAQSAAAPVFKIPYMRFTSSSRSPDVAESIGWTRKSRHQPAFRHEPALIRTLLFRICSLEFRKQTFSFRCFPFIHGQGHF